MTKIKDKSLCARRCCTSNRVGASRWCAKHRHQRNKELNPVRYVYDILRSNAKRRGHEFSITLDYFRAFCEQTKYIETKGRGAGCATIDRIDPRKGYVEGNLQIMEHVANIRKRYADERIFGKSLRAAPIDVADIIRNSNGICDYSIADLPF